MNRLRAFIDRAMVVSFVSALIGLIAMVAACFAAIALGFLLAIGVYIYG